MYDILICQSDMSKGMNINRTLECGVEFDYKLRSCHDLYNFT